MVNVENILHVFFCQTDVLCYLHRLLTMPDGKLVKSVFCSLNALHSQGFPTWVTKAYDLAQAYNIDMDGSATLSPKNFKSLVSEPVKSNFMTNWYTDLQEKPLLRSYRLYKMEFTPECHLAFITLPKYRMPSQFTWPCNRTRKVYATKNWSRPGAVYSLLWNWKWRTFHNKLSN